MNRAAVDALKRHMGDNSRHPVRRAMVTDVSVSDGLVKVSIEPESDLTGWIPYVGPGMAFGKWQVAMFPAVDTEVVVVATDPDCSNFICLGGIYNTEDTPPASTAEGTILFQHKDTGNKFVFNADGTFVIGDDTAVALANVHLKEWGAALVSALNTQMALIIAHTHGAVPPDPTLAPLGGFSAPGSNTITTKVKGT
jgi:phage baseplate assembly protein gpV